MKAIIEVAGSLGAGKTSTVIALGEELAPATVLYIDASPDQKLTHALTPEPPQLTLGRLFGTDAEAIAHREAIDWAFNDLAVPAGEDHELLSIGPLPEELGITEREKLKYGLTRFIENFDYVVIDGYHPMLRACLPDDSVRTLDIITPEDFQSSLFANGLPASLMGEGPHTPALILNQYQEEELPPALDRAIAEQELRLIGKIPRYASHEDYIRKFSDDFQNCLLRLNIPLSQSPQ